MPTDTVNSPPNKANAKFLRLVTGSVGLGVFLLGINLVTSIVLARLLGPEKYGVYVFLLTVMTIVGIPGQAGMPLLAVRESTFYQAERNRAYLRGFLIRQRQFILGWPTLAMLLGYGTQLAVSFYRGLDSLLELGKTDVTDIAEVDRRDRAEREYLE